MLRRHEHRFEAITMTCECGMTAEQFRRGELAHPGTPTSERLHALVRRLYLLRRS